MKIIHITMIGVFIIFIVVFWNIPNFETQKYPVQDYLLLGFIVTEASLFWANTQIENKRRSEDTRIKHSALLAEKILHPLSFSKIMIMNNLHMLWFDEIIERIDPVKGKVIDTHMNPIDVLKDQQAFKWTFQHLESSRNYKKAFDAWQKMNSSIEQGDQKWSKFREKLGDVIEKKLHEYFPSFTSSNTNSNSTEQYDIETIKSISQKTFGENNYNFNKIVVNKINPIFTSSRTYDDETENKIGIMVQNPMTDMVFLSCTSENKDKLDLVKFTELLKQIRNDSTLIEEHDNCYKTSQKIEENLKLFRDEIQLIMEKIDHSKPMEGKCELGY